MYLIENKNWPNSGPNQVRGRRAKTIPTNGARPAALRVQNRDSCGGNREKRENRERGNGELEKVGAIEIRKGGMGK